MPKPGGGGGGGGGDSGGSTVRGTTRDDTFTVASNQALATTTYDGRAGSDTLNLSALTSGVTIKLNNYAGSNSIVYWGRDYAGNYYSADFGDPDPSRVTGTLKSIERLIGTSGDDMLAISAGSGSIFIDGGAGNDNVGAGGAGSSSIVVGGTGSDYIGSGTIMVGGTYAGGIATGDGESDLFSVGTATILDFELGIDRLEVGASSPGQIETILATSWVDISYNGGAAARLTLPGGGVVTLVGLTAAQAATIPLKFYISGGTPQVTGGPNDDLFHAFSSVAEEFILPAGSGHDIIVHFDPANDALVFSYGGPETWSEVIVNGESALRGYYDGGNSSVTLVGLTTEDIDDLAVQAPPSATIADYLLGFA